MSKAWHYSNPVAVRRAVGGAAEELSAATGQRALVVASKGFVGRGGLAPLERTLGEKSFVLFDGVRPNPDLEDLEEALPTLGGEDIDTVIGIGGGSSLDAAKIFAVALQAKDNAALSRVFRDGMPAAWARDVTLITVPTTSGTGAEVTPFATLWDRRRSRKYSVSGDAVYPDLAVLDPMLTITLPPDQTLFTGLDATSHALESLWNVHRSPLSALFAVEALELAVDALPRVLEEPESKEARASMQQASLLAGLAISQTRTALAHAISYAFTLELDVPHGLACSFTLPSLIDVHLERGDIHDGERRLLLRVRRLLEELRLEDLLETFAPRQRIRELLRSPVESSRSGNYPYSDVAPESLALSR